MSSTKTRSHRLAVLAGVAVVVALALALGLRVQALAAPRAPEASVPAPRALDTETPRIPGWSTPSHNHWPLRFQTDLDLLAPLGDGRGNAALWFKDFRKPEGSRYAEAVAMRERCVEHPVLGKHLPPDDALLLEAEPWIDQATMAFYPDLIPPAGYATEIPNLLFALTLARSWAARGDATEDSSAAMEDFRRVIRLGRLLRQEDVVVISDLVGLACIRIGAEMIYERAHRDGDSGLALVASIVVGEAAPQRLLTIQRLSESDIAPFMTRLGEGEYRLELPDPVLDVVLDRAQNASDRRFRIEAILALNIAAELGTEEQKATIRPVLDGLAESQDEILAHSARWSRDTDPSEEYLAEYSSPPWKR